MGGKPFLPNFHGVARGGPRIYRRPQGPRFGLGVGPALPRVPRAPLDHLIRDTRFWEIAYEWSIKSLFYMVV